MDSFYYERLMGLRKTLNNRSKGRVEALKELDEIMKGARDEYGIVELKNKKR